MTRASRYNEPGSARSLSKGRYGLSPVLTASQREDLQKEERRALEK